MLWADRAVLDGCRLCVLGCLGRYDILGRFLTFLDGMFTHWADWVDWDSTNKSIIVLCNNPLMYSKVGPLRSFVYICFLLIVQIPDVHVVCFLMEILQYLGNVLSSIQMPYIIQQNSNAVICHFKATKMICNCIDSLLS